MIEHNRLSENLNKARRANEKIQQRAKKSSKDVTKHHASQGRIKVENSSEAHIEKHSMFGSGQSSPNMDLTSKNLSGEHSPIKEVRTRFKSANPHQGRNRGKTRSMAQT